MPANLFPSAERRPREGRRAGSRGRRPTPAYFAGLVAVAFATVLLPVSYLLLVTALAAGLAWHLAGRLSWILGPSADATSAILYVAAALGFGMPCFFLLRPFLARPQGQDTGIPLERGEEPRLHDFVSGICEALGAPVPTRIRASMDVNASARFAPGAASVVRGRLELVLGLPLVRGLDLAQFAGVLAHELGHFGQGGAMRLVHAVRTVNIRFTRAAAMRSEWELSRGDAGLLGSLLLPLRAAARGCAAMARLVLKAHAKAGQAISCVLLRQMERQADRAAIRLVGGETFAGMVLEARVLEAAWGLASRSLGLALREGRLADDLPALVAAHTRVFIPEVRRKMEQSLLLERTAWFDTHPCLSERVASARRIPGRGVYHATGPAHLLFSDFPGLSRRATVEFYRQDLGREFRPERMVSTGDLITGHSEAQVGEAAVMGYFGGLATPLRPICLEPARVAEAGAAGARERLARARERIEALLPPAMEAVRAYAAADARRLDAAQARALIKAGFLIEPEDFQLGSRGLRHAEAALAAAEARLAEIDDSLAACESAFRERLAAALFLLGGAEVGEKLPGAAVHARESERLVPVLGLLGKAQPRLDALRVAFHSLGILLEHADGDEAARGMEEQVRALSATLRRELLALHGILEGRPHPFSPGGEGVTLSSYALEDLPGEGDVAGLYGAAEEALERCHALHGRIMGRLALAAGRVEGALGFGPLRVDLFPFAPAKDGDKQPEPH